MRVLVTSDWHVDHSVQGLEKAPDVLAAVDHMVEVAVREEYGLFLCLGDVCSPDAGRRFCRYFTLLLMAIEPLRRAGIPAVFIAGNHDVLSWRNCDVPVTSLGPLAAVGYTVFEEPGEMVIQGKDGDVSLIALPYVISAFTRARYGQDPQSFIGRRLEELIDGAGGDRVIVLSHLNIEGATVGQEGDVPRGGDLFLPRLAERSGSVEIVLNGHYHKPQRIRQKVWVPGSPERMDFGEQDDGKAYLVMEV